LLREILLVYLKVSFERGNDITGKLAKSTKPIKASYFGDGVGAAWFTLLDRLIGDCGDVVLSVS
jgi:hypothetical protein